MSEKILLAIDGSEASTRATDAAAQVAKAYAAEVVLLHGREREVVVGKAGGVFDLETTEAAEAVAEEAAEKLKDAGVSVQFAVGSVVVGRLPRAIVETAKAEKVSLIVMGTRGLSDWGALFLGSTTHRVLHLTDVPVLVVP